MDSLLGGYSSASSSEEEDLKPIEPHQTAQAVNQPEQASNLNVTSLLDGDASHLCDKSSLKVPSTDQSAPPETQPPASSSGEPSLLASEQPQPDKTPKMASKPSNAKKARHNKRHMPRANRKNTQHGDLPPELARELARTGHSLDDVSFVDIDATASLTTPSAHFGNGPNRSTVTAKAGRIAKKAGVSRIERRKHQITALAADAAALQAAQRSLGVSVNKRRGRGRGR